MDYEYGQEHQADLPHSDDRVVTLKPEVDACCVQQQGVDDDEGKERDPIAIQIGGSKIEASRIGVYHVGEGDGAFGR